MRAFTKRELYSSQTTNYLQKKSVELSQETSKEMIEVRDVINQILLEREIGEEVEVDDRPCGGICDQSCGLACKNL